MNINGSKTKLLKFRKGGKLARHYYFTRRQNKVEIVTWFKYLGIMQRTSGTSFTRHIQDMATDAIQVIHDTPNLSSSSTGTATLQSQSLSAATYGIQLI
jgi:hypothetical protein